METLYNIFINIEYTTMWYFIARIVTIPIFALLVWFILFVVWLQIAKPKEISFFPIHVLKIRSLSSIVMVSLLMIAYFPFILYFNGHNKFELFQWMSFPFTTLNTYFMLLPFLTSIFILVFIHFRSISKIKKITK